MRTDTRNRIERFLTEHAPPTPCLVVDTDAVSSRVRELTAEFPDAGLRYAVKANPEPAVVAAVLAAGGGFDVAGPAETDLCLAAGARPEALSYGNTIKKPADIAHAYARGVREFVSDAEGDVDNLACFAPGASVSVRLLLDGPSSATPFGRKFGCEPPVAVELLRRAAARGLDPAGLSFHVGSQQLDPVAWEHGISASAKVFAELAADGIALRRLNIGGGFGVPYAEPAPALADYAAAVRNSLRAHFPAGVPELLLEPGRILVAGAGLLRTEVILVAGRASDDPRRWVYLDAGRYNGLAETENEAIRYRFEPVGDRGGEHGPVIIAGPTCDGDDVLYQHTPYALPLALRAGDLLDIPDTGAYTTSYSSICFNGIEPLKTYCLAGGEPVDAH
ncbi:type III PLP-dependent enzyme [Amycolatopsis nigrescens]|uniref:type III PLP-dependent enzyme n=1 Tax=Amycolatopsis nigrescens TaxID=381445 RepID=UPI00037CD2B5|nr:type III PLP-dependent enzyme [Amycolatopsis nigrescens]